jgi:hypothetical protein
MRFGPVFRKRRVLVLTVRAHMRSNANAFVEDLHGVISAADFHLLLRQFVGDAVPVLVKLDMVIDVHTRRFPITVLEAFNRQWPQRRTVQLIEQRFARAFTPAKRPLV